MTLTVFLLPQIMAKTGQEIASNCWICRKTPTKNTL